MATLPIEPGKSTLALWPAIERSRARPASVDSLRTTANQEDFVSMATHAGR